MAIIKVRKYRRKGKNVRAHKRRVKSKITKKERKLFDSMATLPYEVGGQLDMELLC